MEIAQGVVGLQHEWWRVVVLGTMQRGRFNERRMKERKTPCTIDTVMKPSSIDCRSISSTTLYLSPCYCATADAMASRCQDIHMQARLGTVVVLTEYEKEKFRLVDVGTTYLAVLMTVPVYLDFPSVCIL